MQKELECGCENHGVYLWSDICPKTGKLTPEHMENCSGCPLCEYEE